MRECEFGTGMGMDDPQLHNVRCESFRPDFDAYTNNFTSEMREYEFGTGMGMDDWVLCKLHSVRM